MQPDKLPSPFVILPQPQEVVLLKGSGLQHGKLQNMVLKGEYQTSGDGKYPFTADYCRVSRKWNTHI